MAYQGEGVGNEDMDESSEDTSEGMQPIQGFGLR